MQVRLCNLCSIEGVLPVSVADAKVEVRCHASDGSIGDILSIHQGDTIHEAQAGDQSKVYAASDPAGLSGGKHLNGLAVARFFGMLGSILLFVEGCHFELLMKDSEQADWQGRKPVSSRAHSPDIYGCTRLCSTPNFDELR